jgi:glycosyltransferase involved in cell wall biosynthesis
MKMDGLLKLNKYSDSDAEVKMGRCAVLIPHYNNPQGLLKSLSSIGAGEDVDVWVVDDGSRQQPDEVAARKVFGGTIQFVYLPQNQGIQFALNAGLAAIEQQYEYIARLDCGDTCAPNRFRSQMDFLDKNPEIMLLGSAVTFVDIKGRPQYTLTLPEKAQAIRHAMHINCAFVHPAVMWRSAAVEQLGSYPTNYPMAEDYAFFWRFVRGFETANLQDALVFCEINPNGLSISRRKLQLRSRLRLQWRYARANAATVQGVIKTLVLMAVPYEVVLWLKRRRSALT